MDESAFTPAVESTETSTSTAAPNGGYDATSRVASRPEASPAPSAEASAELALLLEPRQLAAAYRLISELLLYPEERDASAVDVNRRALDGAPDVTELIDGFLTSSRAQDLDEYLMLLELAPTCPLYLGTYMFAEPSSCRGAGLSDRNAYMLELKAIYRHFGFEPPSNEMADFLPLIADFLALSLDRDALDGIGLRRLLLDRHVAPALTALREKLETYETPYAGLIACMSLLVKSDAAACPDPAWTDGPAKLELPTLKPFAANTTP